MSRNVQWTHRGPPHHLAAFVGGLGDQPRALWVASFVLQPFAKFTCNDGEREKEKKRKREKEKKRKREKEKKRKREKEKKRKREKEKKEKQVLKPLAKNQNKSVQVSS